MTAADSTHSVRRTFASRIWLAVLACLVGLLGLMGGADSAFGSTSPSSGAFWHEEAAPSPGGSAVLWAVDCVTAANCHAVGSFTARDGSTEPYGETWNGISWTSRLAAPVAGSEDASLYSISCYAKASCIAVGTALIGGTQQAIAERWDGAAWSLLPAAKRTGSALESVSCNSATRCVAVGVEAAGQSNLPLSEVWNGNKWSLVSVPGPQMSINSALYGVACPPDGNGACLAVGQYQDLTSRTRALAERWDGRSWSVLAAKDDADHGDLLTAIACSRALSCLAVGSSTGPTGITTALSETWNGSAWALTPRQPVDVPQAGETSPLGVSCATDQSCVLVGEVAAGGREQPMAEAWDGARWTAQSLRGGGGSFSYLDGISCPSPRACSAVGSNGDGALAEAYGA